MTQIEIHNAGYEEFPPIEGEIHLYYGKPRSGKTYTGTENVIRSLNEGRVVRHTWKIAWPGYDETEKWLARAAGIIGFKPNFNRFDVRNAYWWNTTAPGYTQAQFIKDFNSFTDCELHIDEGQNPLNAYMLRNIPEELMKAIQWTGHFHRSLHVYSQRTMSVHMQLRGNVHFFHKIEKLDDGTGFLGRIIPYFKRPLFQETIFEKVISDGTPDETRIMEYDDLTEQMIETNEYKFAEDQRQYRLNPKIAGIYNSHYLRGNMPPSQNLYAQVIHIPWLHQIKKIGKKIVVP